MVTNWKSVKTVLRTEFPDWGLLLQVMAFHVPLELAINPIIRGQLQTLSDAVGLDSDNFVSEFYALCPIANKVANQVGLAQAFSM